MAGETTSPRELFAVRLRTMLGVERALADRILPALVDDARASDLRWGLERHLVETQEHVAALRRVLEHLGVPAEPLESPALAGLVEEHDRLVAGIPARERALRDLAHAQAAAVTEHLELGSYHALAATADALGEEEVAAILRELEGQEAHALELAEKALTKLIAEKVESPRLV